MNNCLKISFLCFLVGSSVFNVKCAGTDGSENNQQNQDTNDIGREIEISKLINDRDVANKTLELIKQNELNIRKNHKDIEQTLKHIQQNALNIRKNHKDIEQLLEILHNGPTFKQFVKSLIDNPYPAIIGVGVSMMCCFLGHKK